MNVEIQTLENLIIFATMKYDEEFPIMSDLEFDKKIEQLRKLDPHNWILKTTNWGYAAKDANVNHIGKYPVIGLPIKIKHGNGIPQYEKYLVGPKLDGLSIVLTFDKDNVTAATRNNGKVGKDCTENVCHVITNHSPDFFSQTKDFRGMAVIRGEVVVPRRNERKIREKNPDLLPDDAALRNWAAGVINRGEVTADLRLLEFVPYFVRVSSNEQFRNRKEMIDFIAELNLPRIQLSEFDELTPEILEATFEHFKQLYVIDGLVVYEDFEFTNTVDYTEYERRAFAYKFEGETLIVTAGEIEWKTGTTGRVIPTVTLTEPVELSGAKLQRFTGHNGRYIVDNGIEPGTKLKVVRSGECIPYIQEIIERARPNYAPPVPFNCRDCESELYWEGAHIMCGNTSCPAKEYTKIFKFVEGVVGGQDGLSGITIQKWLEEFPTNFDFSYIETIYEFIPLFIQAGPKATMTRQKILQNKFGQSMGLKLKELEIKIEKKLEEGFTFSEFWYICSIPQLGTRASEKMASIDPRELTIGNMNNKLMAVKVNKAVVEGVKTLSDVWDNLLRTTGLELLDYVEKEVKSIGLQVAVTGKIHCMKRPDFIKRLQELGVTVSGVSSKTNYLISNEDSNSGKTKAAKEIGVSVITEEVFVKDVLEKEFGLEI